MKGLMGGFYRISEWIMRFSVTNLLWIVCSLPFALVFTMTLFNLPSLLGETEVSSITQLLFPFIFATILAPFTLFPATAALFTSVRKWIIGDEDAPLLKTFFRGFKSNYLQSMFGGLFYLVIFVVLIVNYSFYADLEGYIQLVSYIFIILTVILLISMFNFFSIMVHFHMKFWQIIKNALLFSIGRPLTSVLILFSNLCILWISFIKITFLIPFFMGSLMAYISFWHFHRVFRKIQVAQLSEQEKQAEQEQLELQQGQQQQEQQEPQEEHSPPVVHNEPSVSAEDSTDHHAPSEEDQSQATGKTSSIEEEIDKDRYRKY